MKYSKINKFDVANGEGVRVSLFVSGCPHHCKGCFNSETWDYDYGEEFTKEVISSILAHCNPDFISGLTLLGGEPLAPANLKQTTLLSAMFKKFYKQKTLWCYTGYDWERIKHLPIMEFIDILVDGRFIEEQKDISLKFRGSRNQRIIDVQESVAKNQVILWRGNK